MICFEHVAKHFGEGAGRVDALRCIDLSVPRSQLCAIMGASGAGKSTLLHAAAGLIPLNGGRILLGDRDLSKLSRNELSLLRRRKIGVVFQFFNLLPFLTAYENIALPLRLDGVSRGDQRRRVGEALARVGLKERADHKPHQLSGGEMQRIAVARALVIEPDVVLADEPTGNLDSVAGRQIMMLLRDINTDLGVTMIVVTHDPVWAALCDRVVRIADGQIEQDMSLVEDESERSDAVAEP